MHTLDDPSVASTVPVAVRGDAAVLSVVDNYPRAQAIVDRLADAGFPVENVRIVGSDLHSVEQVIGRRGLGHATLSGTAAGAWFGLLIGLLLGILTPHLFIPVVTAGVVFAALWGAFFGFVRHWFLRGRRDFASRHQLVATRYHVLVSTVYAARAADLLAPSATTTEEVHHDAH